ncbi:MAG: type IV secretion system protein [Synergistaceae bacterium]|nr:type IV secretion system protein [Synergistaceae bacterium]
MLCVVFFALAIVLVAASIASAVGMNETLDFIEDFTGKIGDKLLAFARSLFIALATVSLAVGLARMTLSGESNLGSIAAHLAKWIIYVGFFMWVMSSGDAVFFIPKVIVNSFMGAGEAISGASPKPDDLLIMAGQLYSRLTQQAWKATGIFEGMAEYIAIWGLCIISFFFLSMLVSILVVTLIEMHIVICGGAILLGFAGFEHTRDIAFSYIKYAVSVGAKILMIMICVALTNAMLQEWLKAAKLEEDLMGLLDFACILVGGSMAIFMVARMVPSMAQSMVSGAVGHFGHEMVTSSAAGLAHGAATAAKTVAKPLAPVARGLAAVVGMGTIAPAFRAYDARQREKAGGSASGRPDGWVAPPDWKNTMGPASRA